MAAAIQRSVDPFSSFPLDTMAPSRQQGPIRDGPASFHTPDFMSSSGFDFSFTGTTEPSWDYNTHPRTEVEGGQQNVPIFDSGLIQGFFNGRPMTQGPTAGSISHSIDARVLSPVSAVSTTSTSWRSPVIHPGSGPAMERVASQLSATDSSGSSRPNRSNLALESTELRLSHSQRSHQFSSGASDTDHTVVSEHAFNASSPHHMEHQAQSELSFQMGDDTSNGYTTFQTGLTNGSHPNGGQPATMSMDSSYNIYQTSMDNYGLASPQDLFSADMATPRDTNPRNETAVHYGPPFVFDGMHTNSPQDFNTLDSMWQDGYNMTGSGMSFENVSVNGSPRSVPRNHTGDDLTPRQQHFPQGLEYYSMPEGSSPSAASQTDSVEAEKLHNAYRSDPLYKNGTPGADGLYHCPFEGQNQCTHKPDKLKCNYDKFVDSHLKPYRCKHKGCEASQFSSTACQLRHEREAHALHGHGEKPYLCTYEGCDRGVAGNGFPRHWNMRDHMRRVHGIEQTPSVGESQPTRGGRKRKAETQESGPAKKVATVPASAVVKDEADSKDNSDKINKDIKLGVHQLTQTVKILDPSHPDFHKNLRTAGKFFQTLFQASQSIRKASESKANNQQSG